MITYRSLCLCAALVCLGFAVAAPGAAVKMEGNYQWNADPNNPGTLEAVFTPDGNGYKVAFHFRFDGRNHTYSGSAEGSLADGPLKGTVKNEDKRRTFTFEGTTSGGNFSGNHAEIGRNGKVIDTGTLTLRPK